MAHRPDNRNGNDKRTNIGAGVGDAATHERDAGTRSGDGVGDAGTRSGDGVGDAGTREHDAGTREHDVGTREHDAGTREHDAGTREHDAGTREHDAGKTHHIRHGDPEYVQDMFDRISPRYDLLNRLISFNMDNIFRNIFLRKVGVVHGQSVLDIACGTGALTSLIASRVGDDNVDGLDFSAGMLSVAQKNYAHLRFHLMDATATDFPDGSFDVITVAYGIRNMPDKGAVLAECHRLLRPNGKFCILDIRIPSRQPMAFVHKLYFGRIMPRFAALFSRGDSDAYRYLPQSVALYPSRSEFGELGAVAGFSSVSHHAIMFGACDTTIFVK